MHLYFILFFFGGGESLELCIERVMAWKDLLSLVRWLLGAIVCLNAAQPNVQSGLAAFVPFWFVGFLYRKWLIIATGRNSLDTQLWN